MKNKNKIRVLFGLFIVTGIISINKEIEFYPSLQFPLFENHKGGINVQFKKVKLINLKDSSLISVAEIVKPYDKRLLLFGPMSLENNVTAPSTLIMFQELYRDGLVLSLELTDTIIIFK